MGTLVRLLVAIAMAVVLSALICGGRAHGSAPSLRLMHDGRSVGVLVPGALIDVVVTGLDANHERYCLGLAGMRDRSQIPVTLATFHPVDDGLMLAHARVPFNVFPAEPAGAFLLFAGRCSDVAPIGNVAAMMVHIVPGLG